MDDKELLEIASRLEAVAKFDKSESQLSTGMPFLWLTATRDALLNIAAACIRAAASPIPIDDCRAEPSLLKHRQIINSKSDYELGAVQRIDEFPENPDVIAKRKRNAWRNDRACLLGCALIGFMVLFMLVSGAMLWWEFLTGQRL